MLCRGSWDGFLTGAASRCFPGKEQNTLFIVKVLSTGNIALSVLNTFSPTRQLKLAGAKAGGATRWQATPAGTNTTLHQDLLGVRAGNNTALKRCCARSAPDPNHCCGPGSCLEKVVMALLGTEEAVLQNCLWFWGLWAQKPVATATGYKQARLSHGAVFCWYLRPFNSDES